MALANPLQDGPPAARPEPPHLIVVDSTSPPRSETPSNVVMLLIAVQGEQANIVDLLSATEDEYCPVITPLGRLVENVESVLGLGRATSLQATRRLLDRLSSSRSSENPAHQLTPHETRLLKLMVDGHTYKSAAETLHISHHTVDFHLRAVYEKLEAHSKSDAVGKALRQGLVR